MPSKITLQKIGTFVVYFSITAFVLFEVLKFSAPFINSKLNESREELKMEITNQLKIKLDSFINYQIAFNNSLNTNVDSIDKNLNIIITISDKQSEAILKLIRTSSMSQQDKMDEVINLLHSEHSEPSEPIIKPKNNNVLLNQITVKKKK